ncbi:hypothetical protein Tco_0094528 [Tanacetum coccineum]
MLIHDVESLSSALGVPTLPLPTSRSQEANVLEACFSASLDPGYCSLMFSVRVKTLKWFHNSELAMKAAIICSFVPPFLTGSVRLSQKSQENSQKQANTDTRIRRVQKEAKDPKL